MKLIEHFDRGVALGRDRPCLIDDRGTRSFGEVEVMSHRIGGALVALGLEPGDSFAVFSHNQSVAFEVMLGGLRAGGCWVPANAASAVAELKHTLSLTGARVLFYAMQVLDQVLAVLPDCPTIAHLICIDAPSEDLPDGHLHLLTFIANMPDRMVAPEFSDDTLVALGSTGGTTGLPKAVMTTHRIWNVRIAATVARIGIDTPPVMICVAPISHAAGAFTLETLGIGTTTVILKGFDAIGVARAIQDHRATHIFLPPTALYRMLSEPGVRAFDFSSLRYFTTASSAISEDKLREAVEVFGPCLEPAYGGTEMGMSVCSYQPDALARDIADGRLERLQSCGKVQPGTDMAIIGSDGAPVAAGQSGEIAVRGPQLLQGYLHNPEETEKALRDGWYHTGDVGFLDPEGYLYIRDRVKEMIISGGFNVYPAEVERVIHSHPAVQDCAVIGVPDADWGERVVAVVELRDGSDVTADDLIATAKAQLTNYKVPKEILFRDLPRSPVGKVLRRALRDEYWQGRERAI